MPTLIEQARARLAGATTRLAGRARHREVVRTNRFDEVAWKGSRASKPTNALVNDLFVGDAHRGGQREGFEPAAELVKGLFQSFYKAAPELADQRELERDLYPVRKIIEELQDNPRIRDLHEYTFTNEMMSTLAVANMADVLQELVLKLQQVEPPPPPGGGSEQGEGGGDDQGDQQPGESQPGEGQGEPGDGDPSDGDPSEGEGDAEGEQAEADWEAAYDEALDGLNIDSYVDQAIDEAINELQEVESRRRNAGLEVGEWEEMSPDKRLEVADWLMTDQMKELSDMVGRIKRFALGVKAERVIDTPTEAYDVEHGNNLQVVLKGQYALLGHEFTTYEFYHRYAMRRLLQFKRRGIEKVGKGPLEVLIDKSSSMNSGTGKITPFYWAMGVAEALRRFAADEERDYHAIFFGQNDDRTRFDFPKGVGTIAKVVQFLSAKANGGTAFDGVLTEGLERASVAYDQEGLSNADIVFITDGNANLSDAWIEKFNKQRAEAGVRVFSIYIGGASDNPGSPVRLLERFSDVVIPITELRVESARQVFALV